MSGPFEGLHAKAEPIEYQTSPKFYIGRFWGVLMSGMDAMTRRLAETFDRMSLPILIASLFLTGFLAYFLAGSLAFTTDLSSFAPETEADEAQERIEGSMGSSPHLVYINVKPSASEDQLANVLEMKALHRLIEDYERIQSHSDENGLFIASQINAAAVSYTHLRAHET